MLLTVLDLGGGKNTVQMVFLDEEWQTYLALESAGPTVTPQGVTGVPPWTGEVPAVKLSNPRSVGLREVLESRRSSRVLWRPLPLSVLLEILYLTLGRPKDRPYSRVYPTSGGCDELGILVVARNVTGLPPAAYWAVGDDRGRLRKAASLENPYFLEFERVASSYWGLPEGATPSAMLIVLADWKSLAARYKNCVLASALWDCGALLQTVSLAAAAVGAKACISACVRPRLVGSWLGIDYREFGHIGTIGIGGGTVQTVANSARTLN